MDLDFIRLEYDVNTAKSDFLTSALYNSLRNFETYFRVSCCQTGQETCASGCPHSGCPYRVVFSQNLSSDPEIVRLHQKPSLPFSLYISGSDDSLLPYTVGMVVIGSAVNYIKSFHTAFLQMIETWVSDVMSQSKLILRSYSLDYQGDRHELTNIEAMPDDVILLSSLHILRSTVHAECGRLSFISPLRVLNGGSIAHRFDFDVFLRSQMRRCSSLFAYYGTGELILDFAKISECAKKVTVLDDSVHYYQPSWSKNLNRGGLVGTIDCADLVEPMFSLLLLGSYFNAGKGATFGLGYHRLALL